MAIKKTNVTLDGLTYTLDDRDRVAAELVNENDNTFTGTNIFSGPVTVGSIRTFLATDTTPDVASGSYWYTHASVQTLTHFNGGTVGQLLFVESTAAVTYDVSSNAAMTCGSADLVTADGDLVSWIYNGTEWICIMFSDLSSDFNAVS